jgi:hypothetical protein
MKVAFDYLYGPVLGHRVRCEVLQEQLSVMGHRLVSADSEYDWLVVDYPANSIPEANGNRRLLMGTIPSRTGDYGWHPLGPIANYTLHGTQYIIIDPKLQAYKNDEVKDGILITCGGADPFGTTERLLELLADEINVDVIVGPNFGRDIVVPKNCLRYDTLSHSGMAQIMAGYKTVIAAWGNTVFEALALGARVIPITTQPEHPAEARALGIPYIKRECLYDYTIAHELAGAPYCDYGIDFLGARRVVEFMEYVV